MATLTRNVPEHVIHLLATVENWKWMNTMNRHQDIWGLTRYIPKPKPKIQGSKHRHVWLLSGTLILSRVETIWRAAQTTWTRSVYKAQNHPDQFLSIPESEKCALSNSRSKSSASAVRSFSANRADSDECTWIQKIFWELEQTSSFQPENVVVNMQGSSTMLVGIPTLSEQVQTIGESRWIQNPYFSVAL